MNKITKIIIGIVVLIIIIFVISLAGDETNTKDQSNEKTSQEIVEKDVVEDVSNDVEVPEETGSIIPYTLIEEDDISYAGCKRVAFRITVADDADSKDVDVTLQSIIDENKPAWDDITVWAWKENETSKVGATPATMGTKEYSVC